MDGPQGWTAEPPQGPKGWSATPPAGPQGWTRDAPTATHPGETAPKIKMKLTPEPAGKIAGTEKMPVPIQTSPEGPSMAHRAGQWIAQNLPDKKTLLSPDLISDAIGNVTDWTQQKVQDAAEAAFTKVGVTSPREQAEKLTRELVQMPMAMIGTGVAMPRMAKEATKVAEAPEAAPTPAKPPEPSAAPPIRVTELAEPVGPQGWSVAPPVKPESAGAAAPPSTNSPQKTSRRSRRRTKAPRSASSCSPPRPRRAPTSMNGSRPRASFKNIRGAKRATPSRRARRWISSASLPARSTVRTRSRC